MRSPTPTDPLIGAPARRSSTSRLAQLGFWTLGIAILVNFNHLFNMTIGMGWPISLGLTLCCLLLCLSIRMPLRQTSGLPGFLIVATLTAYLFLGLSVAVVSDNAWYFADRTLPLRVGLAVLIVVATARGASAELRRLGVERLLGRILMILAVTCLAIPATPFLLNHVYVLPGHLVDIRDSHTYRFMGTFTSPNFAGEVACYAAGLALVFLNNGIRYRKFASVVLILSSVAVLLTFSRAAILTLVGLFLFSGLSSLSRFRPEPRNIVSMLLIILIGGGVSLVIFAPERLPIAESYATDPRWVWLRTFGAFDEFAKLGSRAVLWSLGSLRIAESPFFGHGLLHLHHLADAPTCRLGVQCGVHNTYLMLWGEAGVIPFSLFVCFTGSLLWKAFMLPRSIATQTVAVFTFVFVIASLRVDGTLYFFWHAFILGLTCALARHATRESRRRKSGPAVETRPVSARTRAHGIEPRTTG